MREFAIILRDCMVLSAKSSLSGSRHNVRRINLFVGDKSPQLSMMSAVCWIHFGVRESERDSRRELAENDDDRK